MNHQIDNFQARISELIQLPCERRIVIATQDRRYLRDDIMRVTDYPRVTNLDIFDLGRRVNHSSP